MVKPGKRPLAKGGYSSWLIPLATDELQNFYRWEYLKLYDAAQEGLTEMLQGSTNDAERIPLRAGIEDPDF